MAESNFSEMFARLESKVDMGRCRTFGNVKLTLASWMANWHETDGQLKLVKLECKPSTITTDQKEYCRYCGAENKSDAVFCEKCGKQIT